MKPNAISLKPADYMEHYATIAALISSQETEPTTKQSLKEWYSKQEEDGASMHVAETTDGCMVGFYCLYLANKNREGLYGMYLIVDERYRRQGIGKELYEQLISVARELKAKTLRVRVRDDNPVSIDFATRRGFIEKGRTIEMRLDLKTWDESVLTGTMETLQEQGFRFTNMVELADTPEARRKLYQLNNGAAATDPGSNGIAPWATFEEFERDVCSSSWYHSDAQFVAIDTRTGEWAAMSAITVFESADHAYNLFTSTDTRFRGRKLAQAVKGMALRRTRAFDVDTVRTSHASENAAMIAIDTKLGYIRTPGTLVMEKELGN